MAAAGGYLIQAIPDSLLSVRPIRTVQIHDLYYNAKPFIPWTLRLMARRLYLSRRKHRCDAAWPIDPAAGRKPENWPGWPHGKKFAFVLTHDVEGIEGVQKCARLMDTERSLGFRSCYNFIPQGDYSVPAELRALLKKNGFEVGVHDLYHDGKLYRSREGFREHARLINKHLRDWQAVGFRSGFMHHNLDWIHDLEITYDCSTFDTDPFEPQPDGMGTIFPFWMARQEPVEPSEPWARAGAAGYMELPYTLPQDSTLFLIFSQKNINTWKQKLEWIAEHGGMALLNVHPDYMYFDGKKPFKPSYSSDLYVEFLTWVREKYAGAFWNALPSEVADFCSAFKPMRPRVQRRICMLTHSYYKSDARVTRYAEALAARGDHVDVLALRASPESPVEEMVKGVRLVQLQDRYGKKEKSRLSYLFPILRFLVKASGWIARSHRMARYDLLHIHNVPDFLVFAGLLPKLSGARVILDIHDIVPEFYASKFSKKETSALFRMLKFAERASCKVADHVIIANHLWHDKYAKRTGAMDKCSVFINNVDRSIFSPIPRTRNDGKIQVIFPGGLQWHQGMDIAIRAFAKVLATLDSGFRSPRSDSGLSTLNNQQSGPPTPQTAPSSDKLLNPSTPKPFGAGLSTPNSQLSTVCNGSPPTAHSSLPTAVPSGLSTPNSQLSTNLEFHIYGDGNMKPSLVELTKELGLESKVFFHHSLPVRKIAEVMANADLGVVPKRADSFGNEAYSTKIMEFMSVGVPVVVSSTKIDRYYFDNSLVRFFPSGDHEAMAAQMIDLLKDNAARQRQVTNALNYAAANSWEGPKKEYLRLVDALIEERCAKPFLGPVIRERATGPVREPLEQATIGVG